MMQETRTIGPTNSVPWDFLSGQSLVTLLALVGTKQMSVEDLRRKTKLTPEAFESLLGWLQREYLIDLISTLEGNQVEEDAVLTDRGETLLVSMLEKTCELPELS
jgi:hypothetical protein